MADHLSRLEYTEGEGNENREIKDVFHEEHLYLVQENYAQIHGRPQITDFANYIVGQIILAHLPHQQRKNFLSDVKHYVWEDTFLYKCCADLVVWRCVSHTEGWKILEQCHSGVIGGHFSVNHTAEKVLEASFFWPILFMDAQKLVTTCDQCQRSQNLSKLDEMKQTPIQQCDVFDVWGIYFMGPLPSLNGNKQVLVVEDYVSKWVKAQEHPTNDARVVVKFLKNFSRDLAPQEQLLVIEEHIFAMLSLRRS